MRSLQSLLQGVTKINSSTDIYFSDETKMFLTESHIADIYQIELIDGSALLSDMIDFFDNNFLACTSFFEICIKASQAKIYFKDYHSDGIVNPFLYTKEKFFSLESNKNPDDRRRLLSFLRSSKKYLLFISKPIDNFNFKSTTVKSLALNNINEFSELLGLSRAELLQMNQIGLPTIEDIVDVLSEHYILLKNDKYYVCKYCKSEFIGSLEEDDEAICPDCFQRLKRLKKKRKYEIDVKVVTDFWENEGDGFIIYANVNNETNSIQTLTLKQAYIIDSRRQWVSNAYVTGYKLFEEDITPKSFKTLGRIWYNKYFKCDGLCDGDELFLEIYSSLENKVYFYKFRYQHNEFILYDIVAR